MTTRTIAVSLLAALAMACVADQIRESHVDGNVPSSGDVDRLLQRDLNAFFAGRLPAGGNVRYEFLRKAPTQTGVAYPKFYLWVWLPAPDGGTLQGAVRIAAINQQRYEVTDFLSEADIRRDPGRTRRVFPAVVCERIAARLRLP